MDSTLSRIEVKSKQGRFSYNDRPFVNNNDFQRINPIKSNKSKSNYNIGNIISYLVSLHRNGVEDTKKMMAEVKTIGIMLYLLGIPLFAVSWWENLGNTKGDILSWIAVFSTSSFAIYRFIKQYYLVQEMKRKSRREELELKLKEIELKEQINEHQNEHDNADN